MASLYTTLATASGVATRSHLREQSISAQFDLAVEGGGALVVNDVIRMVKIPAGAKVLDVLMTATDLDAGTDIVLDVGDGDDTDRYIDGSTIGQTGGIERLNAYAGHVHEYDDDDTIDVLVQAAPTGTAVVTGTITLTVFYTMEKVYGF